MVESNYVPFQYISLRHEYDAIYIAHLSDNRIDRLHVYKFTQSSFIHFNPLLFTMPILCPYIFRLQFSIFPPKGIFSIWLVNMWRTSNQVDELPFPSNVSRQIFKIFTILVFLSRNILRWTHLISISKFMLEGKIILFIQTYLVTNPIEKLNWFHLVGIYHCSSTKLLKTQIESTNELKHHKYNKKLLMWISNLMNVIKSRWLWYKNVTYINNEWLRNREIEHTTKCINNKQLYLEIDHVDPLRNYILVIFPTHESFTQLISTNIGSFYECVA